MATRKTKFNAEDSDAPNDTPTFETSIQRLAAIVEELESGEHPLEQSLRLFEEGVLLAKSSQATLDAAEKRVELLLEISEDGRPVVEELDADE